ncbi:MAG: hypothetical protein DSY60_00530 [Persephonella sp.]|nr:MAG: hypothetical protein DSY60_00530 [Persephonella sp.]
MVRIINIVFLINFLLNLTCFGKELNDIKYVSDYIKHIENLTDAKISYITNITFQCYYYYITKLKTLEKDILKSAEKGRQNKFPIIPSNGYSYCPKVIVNVSSAPLEPEGIFRKGVIIINYDPSKMCKEKELFGVFKEKICEKPNFDLTLMHELTHFAFSKIYGNIKFRKVLFDSYDRCMEENCSELPLLNEIVAYRNFYDEFSAILFSNIWIKLQKCSFADVKDLPNFKFFIRTTLFLSKKEFLTCRLNGDCGVFYLYKQLRNISNSFNLCLPKKEAFKSLIKICINKEKKDLLPLLKTYLQSF